MPRVDFYILSNNSSAAEFACVMVGKARNQGHLVHIQTETRQDAVMLDELLWRHGDITFLPHKLADSQGGNAAPVNIGWEGIKPETDDILINLADIIPACSTAFNRIIEIVPSYDPQRERARDRFRQYREQGYEIHNHKLEGKHAGT